MVRNVLNPIKLDDVVRTFTEQKATDSVVALATRLSAMSGMLESGMKMTYRLLFEQLGPSDEDIDMVQSNLA